jgi:hypothetical protein
MKRVLFFFVALFSLAFPLFAQRAPAAGGAGTVKLGKVEVTAPNTPQFQLSGGSEKRSKVGKWLEMEVEYTTTADEPELTFKYTVQFEKNLLPGEVTYVSVLKGKDHYAVMYISPKVVERLMAGRALTATSVENVWVEVSRSGQVLDRASMKPGNPPNLPQVAGLISNKNDTPFAPLFFDRYETIKQGR